jgi:hypothetical protein
MILKVCSFIKRTYKMNILKVIICTFSHKYLRKLPKLFVIP